MTPDSHRYLGLVRVARNRLARFLPRLETLRWGRRLGTFRVARLGLADLPVVEPL
jgi:hypothetical protein